MTILKTAIALVALLAIVVVAGALRLQQTGTERTDVVDAHHMREIYTFDSIGQMVAASDAVVVGVVRESYPGRVVEEDADVGGGLSFTEVVVDVDRVFEGIDSKALTLEIDEISAGDNREWLTPGATVMLGLTQIADEPPLYRPTNTQSVFVFVGDRVVPGLNRDEFTNRAAAVDRATFLREVEAAAASVMDGSVTAPPTN